MTDTALEEEAAGDRKVLGDVMQLISVQAETRREKNFNKKRGIHKSEKSSQDYLDLFMK